MADNTTLNGDGSVDLPVDGKTVRFVKESDLLAVKSGSESKVKEWETEKSTLSTDLAESNRLREESHTQLLQERAAKEQLVTTYSDYDTFKTKVGELETELGSTKELLGKHETELTGRIRQGLITVHGASEEAVKEKTLDQLRNLEEAAKVFGVGNKDGTPANFGGEGVPGGGSAPESSLDRAKRILEAHESKRAPMQVTGSAVGK